MFPLRDQLKVRMTINQVLPPTPSARANHLIRVGSRQVDMQVELLQRQGQFILPLLPYPNRALPEHVIQAAIRAVCEPHSPPSRGLLVLRDAIARRLAIELSHMYDPEQEILVTNGGMHALFVAFATLLDPGDELIVPAPCYFIQGIADLLGFRIVYVHMHEAENFRFEFERLAAAVTPRTRAIFLNTPVNPTGYVLTTNDLAYLVELAANRGLWLVSDESYDRMIYDGACHTSPLNVPGAQRLTVLVRSMTKSYAMPAWRVGFVAAPATAVEKMTRVLEWQSLYGNGISQAAAAAALSGPQEWLDGVAAEFQRNRDCLIGALEPSPYLTCVVPQGGPFLFVNVSRLQVDGDYFARFILEQYGIAATPGSTLGSSAHVRIPIGGALETAGEAGARLNRAAEQIASRKEPSS